MIIPRCLSGGHCGRPPLNALGPREVVCGSRNEVFSFCNRGPHALETPFAAQELVLARKLAANWEGFSSRRWGSRGDSPPGARAPRRARTCASGCDRRLSPPPRSQHGHTGPGRTSGRRPAPPLGGPPEAFGRRIGTCRAGRGRVWEEHGRARRGSGAHAGQGVAVFVPTFSNGRADRQDKGTIGARDG